jgi:putative chitinase
MISAAQLAAICPACRNPALWADLLTRILPEYGIETRAQLAAFIGQVAVESQQFNRLTENLNYSAEGLLKTWPTRFTPTLAAQMARDPERIANYVYANRLGNGPPESGDGWKNRGHGLIQTTGADNINAALKALGLPPGDPSPLASPEPAVRSAGLYWQSRRCNEVAHNDTALTKRVNGGTHGLADRTRFRLKALETL